ncbi:MAG: GAF domain-containing protein, partial [bacterium]
MSPGLIVGYLLVAGLLVWIYRLKKRQHYLEYISACYDQEKEAVLSLLNKIGERVTESIDLVGALEIIADFIVEYTSAEAGAIFLVDRGGKELSAKVVLGLFPPLHETTGYVLTKRKYLVEKVKKDKIRIGEGIVGAVAEKGEPLLIEDATSDPRVPKSSGDFLAMKSLMLAPLRVRDKIVGVFVVVNKKNDQHFNSRDMQ